MQYSQIAQAELKVDVYDGPKCDQHRKYWNGYWEGDKQDEEIEGALILNTSDLPAGTRIVISVPLCPKCECTQELCEISDCSFDWKQWIDNEYS